MEIKADWLSPQVRVKVKAAYDERELRISQIMEDDFRAKWYVLENDADEDKTKFVLNTLRLDDEKSKMYLKLSLKRVISELDEVQETLSQVDELKDREQMLIKRVALLKQKTEEE